MKKLHYHEFCVKKKKKVLSIRPSYSFSHLHHNHQTLLFKVLRVDVCVCVRVQPLTLSSPVMPHGITGLESVKLKRNDISTLMKIRRGKTADKST
jgi:hypothetical protein